MPVSSTPHRKELPMTRSELLSSAMPVEAKNTGDGYVELTVRAEDMTPEMRDWCKQVHEHFGSKEFSVDWEPIGDGGGIILKLP
jgi:hypothetical protein